MVTIAAKPNWFPSEENEKLILDFILWFSRIEYAMKNTGQFHKIRKKPQILEPNWAEMKKHVTGQPVSLALRDAVIYLAASPPQTQVDHYNWVPVQGDSDWPFLIDVLKTVRNNLFHGGKHVPAQLLSPVRDTELLIYCIAIMRELINIVPEHVQIVFDTT
jgi:hypothetical protein